MGTCAFLQQGEARVLLVVLVQCALKRAEGGEAGKKHYLQKMENGFIAEYFHQLMLSHLLQVRDVYSIVAPMFGRRINFMYCALSMLRVVFNLPCCFLSFLSHRIVVKPCRALGVVPVTGCPLFFFPGLFMYCRGYFLSHTRIISHRYIATSHRDIIVCR